ncbi:minor tail protein [Gordonia phage PCoral7]|uniref:Minor tail protein n=1 Tax=Gordonia phage Toast TaxID=2599852 RepID=A0A5J6TAW8_9CAUD|nr:minor tail protein [Gordonia phage Toast]QFG08093.1 minor tail protein [Gordonia phage Toast]UVF60540.1 minor tail protein [Gordonia phage PCoral7]
MTTLVGSDGQTVTIVAPQSGSIDVTPPTSAGLLIPVPGVPGPPGPQGEGFNLIPPYFADTYATLPALDEEAAGGAMLVLESGLLYFWSGVAWTDEGAGVPFRGETGLPGRGIADVDIIGNQLKLVMSDATTDTVTVPAIQQAIDSAAAASGSATAANTARLGAEAAASTAGTAASTATSERTAAQTARTGAEAARDTATTAATTASNSAGAAATSETNAETSADAADGSAVAAAGSATTAAGHATAASAARTGAETARTGAESARDTAQASATAAAGSAEDASGSAQAAAASAAEAADVVLSGVPNATDATKGGIVLAGDLAGTWDNPTVPGLAGKADLIDGKVPTAQIPARGLVVPHPVADTAARLALTDVQPGDIAIQSGNPGRGTYMLMDDDPSDPGSWVLQVAPTDAVSSVNGYQGIVVLGKGDVGLGNVDNTSDAAKPISTATQTALDGKLDRRSGVNVVYTNGADGLPAGQNFTSAATNFTLPIRNSAGTFYVGTPTDTGHPATKAYVDTGLGGKAATAHSHAASDITSGILDVARLPVGTGSTQVAAGNDSRIVNAVPNTRAVNAGTGLDGGGTLDASRTLSVKYGNTAGTAAQGDDVRLGDTRTPTDNTVSTAKIQNGAVTVAKLGSDVAPQIQGMIDTSVLAAQRITVNAQTGAYTLVLTDANKAVEVTTASAVNLTIPTDASVNFPVGTVIEVDQMGAGKVTIVGASGVTIQSAVTPPTTRTQYSAVVLRKRGANLWLVTGDM